MTNMNFVPLKVWVLKELKDNGEAWTIDITENVLGGSNTNKSLRWKWVIRFYLMELELNGMVIGTDRRIADEAYYAQKDVLESKYKITKLGVERLEAVVKL